MFLGFENKSTEIWSKERSIGPYEAKLFFLQVDEGFLAILVSEKKISKLNIVLFNFDVIPRLIADFRKI